MRQSLLVKKSQQSLKEAKHQKVEFERSYHRDLIDKLNSTEAKLIEIRHENERLLAKSNRTMIKSPVSGVIKVINVNTIGASITPGMSILEVVLTDGVLMIESKVRPQDVAHLRPGMQAVVKLSAYDYLIYGTLKGKLINLSADTITDDKGNTFYSAYVKVNKNQDNIELSKMDLIPGMIAEVDLVSGKRSILSYLLKPLLKTKHKALKNINYISF